MQISLDAFNADANDRYYFHESMYNELQKILVAMRGHYPEPAPVKGVPPTVTQKDSDSSFEARYSRAMSAELEYRSKLSEAVKELLAFAGVKE